MSVIRESALKAITDVVDSGWYILGPEVKRFETLFAEYIGVPYCVGLGNGTDALELSLRALGVKPGTIVATVANAGMYTTIAMNAIQCTPQFMDVNTSSCCADLDAVVKAVEGGAHGVVITHLYGLLAPQIEEIAAYCKEKNVFLLEDCSQAHGAQRDGKKAGSFGDAAAFSFYPTKNLGALGDGGAVVASSEKIAASVRQLRQYGWSRKYSVDLPGGRNSRLDEIQAAVLSAQLPALDENNRRRRAIADFYNTSIANPLVTLPGHSGPEYVAHLYVLQTEFRSELQEHMLQHHVMTDVHYPKPDHVQEIALENIGYVKLENTEKLASQVLTLPCYPELTDDECSIIVNALNTFSI